MQDNERNITGAEGTQDVGAAECEPLGEAATDVARESDARAEGGKLVPVTEAIRYRKRAQSAEQEVSQLQRQVQELQKELEQSRQGLDRLERRQKIDSLLAQSQAVDVEVARLLTEAAVEGMDEPDIRVAVEDLRRHKPYLFRQHGGDSGLMAPRGREIDASQAAQAAQQAAASGDRRDLLRYLRARRARA